MRDCLGLSVGATNLVAARADGSSTVRPAAVTWRGSVLTGFVERVGDPIPIVAPDGSAHPGERLVAHALTDLISAAGGPREGMSMAVPAHWREHVVARLRALRPEVPVVSDATAALTALRANPRLPARGIVMLCDFGATGTSITLADAARAFQPIAPTVRYDDFSGQLIDRMVLAHLLADVDVDPAHTSAVASLVGFREHCRVAKERLSHQTATGLPGPVPGSTVRFTRTELEALLQEPLDGLLDAIDDTLRRTGISPAGLAAVATVGGGARIPFVTQRLSQSLRIAVTTTPDAQTVAAIGAALLAGREPESVTRVVAAPQTGTLLAAAVPAPAALAWSQESFADDPAPDPAWEDDEWARPEVVYEPHDVGDDSVLPVLPWYQRPALLFAGAACAVVLASVGLVVTTNTDAANASASAPIVTAPAQPETQMPGLVAAGPSAVVTQTVVENPNVVTYTQAPPVRQEPAPNGTAAAPQVPQAPAPAPEAPPDPATSTSTPTTTSPTSTSTSTPTSTSTTTSTSTPTSTSTTTATSTPTSSSTPTSTSTSTSTSRLPPSSPPPASSPPEDGPSSGAGRASASG